MPYREVEVSPELFLVHKGVAVYRTYRDENVDEPQTYWFDLNPTHGASREFDVRGLKAWKTIADNLTRATAEEELVRPALIEAIDTGELKSKTQHTFKVTWEIEVEACNIIEAAKECRAIHMDPNSLGTVFNVADSFGNVVSVDLREIDSKRKNKK